MSASTAPTCGPRCAGADSVWAYLPAFPPKERAEYEALLASMVQNKDICPFAVIVDGKAKGHMWMMEIRPDARRVRGRLDHLFAVAPAHAAPPPRRCT